MYIILIIDIDTYLGIYLPTDIVNMSFVVVVLDSSKRLLNFLKAL